MSRPRAAALLGASLIGALGLGGCRGTDSIEDAHDQARSRASEPADRRQARLAAYEAEARAETNWAERPASNGRFGVDPYRLLALDGGQTAVVLRGADTLAIVDEAGAVLRSAPTPPDPRDLALAPSGDELLVVGTGAPVVARYELASLAPRGEIALAGALAPRAITVAGGRIWVADEGYGRLHEITARDDPDAPWAVRTTPHCRGPLSLDAVDDLLVSNCLVEHRVRLDRIGAAGLEPLAAGVVHDGPIWSLALGPRVDDPDHGAVQLLALTGVEDHPLERRDGGFGYIDSFAWIYALVEVDGELTLERRASVNLSAHGVVTPKWVRWLDADAGTEAGLGLITGGYASAPIVELRWSEDLDLTGPPQVRARPGLPGTHDVVARPDGSLLASDPLADALVRLSPEAATTIELPDFGQRDDRSADERLGELLVYTIAMAPWNRAEGKRSRFTCETCHFEGRGDGRIHFTGRMFEGEPVHATAKPLLGLFANRPHFSRALDRSLAIMVDNEFDVANRHGARGSEFSLGVDELPWLADLIGWPTAREASPEDLRRALMAFLIRWSMPRNPATRGRTSFTALEAEGARLFATHCEGCHEARLAADLPATRVELGDPAELEPWRALIFAANGPIVWASDAYVQTGIRPYVHPEGARVPSLRRLHFKGPYFTNGGARSLAAVVEGVRLGADGVDHELGPPGADQRGLSPREREALLAFLRLL